MRGFGTRALVARYESVWTARGYAGGIPDEVPAALMADGLAPSYKAICLAILRNDIGLRALGFDPLTPRHIEQAAAGFRRPTYDKELSA